MERDEALLYYTHHSQQEFNLLDAEVTPSINMTTEKGNQ